MTKWVVNLKLTAHFFYIFHSFFLVEDVKYLGSILVKKQYNALRIYPFLYAILDLTTFEVETLLKGYDLVLEFWKNKKKDKKTLIKLSLLSVEEVDYLMDLFQKNQN